MDNRFANLRKEKRRRHVALAEVALKVCDLLEAEGVSMDEGCTVRRIAEDMWNSSRCFDQPCAPDTSNDMCVGREPGPC